jgi:glycine dehydrogenase subunit 2
MTRTSFEKSQEGQHAYSLPKSASEWAHFSPDEQFLRKIPLTLPEISELDLTRHFIGLSRRNVGIDNIFYPLGSCTMKLNPRINETMASLESFTSAHPLAPDSTVQGCLMVIEELIAFLAELTGMSGGTLLPNAGAQGEFVGVKMIAAYHMSRQDAKRTEFLVPDSAHGTNPATVKMAGFEIKTLKSNASGDIDLEDLRSKVSDKTAGLMLTNPNTLGLFSPNILEIARIVHENGGLLYYDGANLNPILTIAKPGEMGFDVMHINLHKTFSTPHGGGGPGSGPVLCKEHLRPYLPVPEVVQGKAIWEKSSSIGGISAFHGNFAIYLRALAYARLHGFYGLRKIAENAVLNANYLKFHLSQLFTVPFPQSCMHEFVVQADRFLNVDVKALDIAKRLLDYGVHAPTVYFPQIVKECFLIEPTEGESKQTLDHFIDCFKKIVAEIIENPEIVKLAPISTLVGRLDEIQAAKNPIWVDPLVKLSIEARRRRSL